MTTLTVFYVITLQPLSSQPTIDLCPVQTPEPPEPHPRLCRAFKQFVGTRFQLQLPWLRSSFKCILRWHWQMEHNGNYYGPDKGGKGNRWPGICGLYSFSWSITHPPPVSDGEHVSIVSVSVERCDGLYHRNYSNQWTVARRSNWQVVLFSGRMMWFLWGHGKILKCFSVNIYLTKKFNSFLISQRMAGIWVNDIRHTWLQYQ